jgi:hypothetical protein
MTKTYLDYVAPEVELIEVAAEQGFSASAGFEIDGNFEEEDAIW